MRAMSWLSILSKFIPRTCLVMVARSSSNRRLHEEPLGFFPRAFGVFAVFVCAMGERCQAKEGVGQGDA